MNEFVGMVLHELLQSIGQAIAVVLLAVGIIVYVYFKHKAKYGAEKPFPWKKTILILLLTGYLAVVSYATFSRLSGMGASGFSFHLFRAWREAWNNYSVTGWLNVLLNIAMLVPLGILVPLLFKRCRKWYFMLLAGFLTALYIEGMQYLSGRGIFDVDDLFNNTLGVMIGYFLLMIVLSIFREKGRRWKGILCYSILTLLPIMVICSIFIAYNVQEYGNLPGAATYRIDTGHVEWKLECELPDVPETVSIYKMDPPTQEECDALRDTFEEVLGVEFERTDYYDESIMYMDQWGDVNDWNDLTVQRIDGSFTYVGAWEESLTPAETDRQTIEVLLEAFGITVPQKAEFGYEHSGWHAFTADRIIDGSAMVDGELKCVYNEEGILSEIKSSLIVYTYHGEEPIFSPREAYEKLRSGEFGDENQEFLRYDPKQVTVTGCQLSYEPDTKGFHQPVYIFEVMFGESELETTVMIPALR